MKLKLEKLIKLEPKEIKTLRKDQMIKLSGGYTYKYTGCSNSGDHGDCTDGSFD